MAGSPVRSDTSFISGTSPASARSHARKGTCSFVSSSRSRIGPRAPRDRVWSLSRGHGSRCDSTPGTSPPSSSRSPARAARTNEVERCPKGWSLVPGPLGASTRVRLRPRRRRGHRARLRGLPPNEASACAAVFRDDAPVQLAGEEALIIWSPDAGVQHLIRKIGFRGATEDFAFLVPTPGRPELGEASPSVFSSLFELYRRPPPAPRRGSAEWLDRERPEVGDPFVSVVERRVVAGLDTAVLVASDVDALDAWLREHRFSSGRAVRRWLEPYVARSFFVTAFRYAPTETGVTFSSANVRMSFASAVPFFPYSEPRTGRQGAARPFRVSVIAPHRVEAREGARRARARVGFAQHLPSSELRWVFPGAVSGLPAPEGGAWLTVFDEPRSRRGRQDLTFVRSRSRAPVRSRIARRIVVDGDDLERDESDSW